MKSVIKIIAGATLLLMPYWQGSGCINTYKGEIYTYTSKEIGWTIEVPKGWTIVEQDQVDETTKKGYETVTEVIGEELDYSGFKNLLTLKKDYINSFQSFSEAFVPEFEGEWEQYNAAVKELIYETISSQGIQVDSSLTSTEEIDGLIFQKYSFKIYSSEDEVIMNQLMYSRLINGFDFGVNINYNNSKDRDELLAAFRNSKFKQE